MARPKGQSSKMKIWTDALKTVLEGKKVIFLTDEDLVLLVNREIKKHGDPRCIISNRQFRRWKAGEIENEHAEEFLEILQLAYIDMKEVVGEKLMNDANFTRWAWILERKFSSEFALVHKQETTRTNQTIIQIEAGSESKKNLIDAIRNGTVIDINYQDVEPLKINMPTSTDNEKSDEYDF
ncbi:MAG: hypothetical protein EOO50_05255 [Flavobacterium sp.]|uniref:hypothetical protein n=1 Tax=Flavobacterium sp. TaxID=239 RepID=UPI001214B6B5|nr:hypothetical protein [Flavobacterium sp.]RZJ67691.1 MAG: hypothetical protein EOO50_05255 [Flavobacterium sp.]